MDLADVSRSRLSEGPTFFLGRENPFIVEAKNGDRFMIQPNATPPGRLRGLDMARAGEVFAGPTLTVENERRDHGEPRSLTIGVLPLAWRSEREAQCRIIKMRKAHDREQARYASRFR